jgi:hypothetical protein
VYPDASHGFLNNHPPDDQTPLLMMLNRIAARWVDRLLFPAENANQARRTTRSSRLTSTVSSTEATTENNNTSRQPSPPPSGRTSTFPNRMPLD